MEKRIDAYLDQINEVMHSAAKESGCVPKSSYRPKPWWCPALSQLRDKKRFWRMIWIDIDRPTQGAVYECYKAAKKLFRKTSRKNANNVLSRNFSEVDTYYRDRKMSSFWNAIQKRHKRQPSSALPVDTLANYYANIMQDNSPLTPDQQTR